MATDSEPANRSKSRVTIEDLITPNEESEKRRRGRPPKYSKAIVDCICRGIESGLTHKAAAGIVGIHEDTFYDWIKDKPGFSESVYHAECVAEARFVLIAHNGVESCTPDQARYWLEHMPLTRKIWSPHTTSTKIDLTADSSSDPSSPETIISAQVTITQRKSYNNDVLERYVLEKEAELAEAVTSDSDTPA